MSRSIKIFISVVVGAVVFSSCGKAKIASVSKIAKPTASQNQTLTADSGVQITRFQYQTPSPMIEWDVAGQSKPLNFVVFSCDSNGDCLGAFEINCIGKTTCTLNTYDTNSTYSIQLVTTKSGSTTQYHLEACGISEMTLLEQEGLEIGAYDENDQLVSDFVGELAGISTRGLCSQ